MSTPDLSVAGPGSPVSLRKFLDNHGEGLKPLSVLVDGTGTGIMKDEDSVIYITAQDCAEQALYYSKNIFNGVNIPEYLYRYLAFMMLDRKYQTKEELIQDMKDGKITAESDDYKHILNLIKYCEGSAESKQIIGLIQLLAGIMNEAKNAKVNIRIYLEHPETHLHPKRCSRFMSMFHHLNEEYGFADLEQKE